MKKQSKETIILFIALLLLLGLYLFYQFININNINLGVLSNEYVGFIFIIAILILLYYGIKRIKCIKNGNNSQYKEKMFNSLVNKNDTIYLMYDYNLSKIVYMTKNVNQVLENSDQEDSKYELDKISNIFNLPIVKNEISSWDKKSEFISQMIAYSSLSYQHDRWLKIKIYPVYEKHKLLYIVLISDATKDHDRQHLLISQASDIKNREKKLNQITASSYDTEIDVNLDTGLSLYIDLKQYNEFENLKKHKYTEDLENNILKYVSDEDMNDVKNLLKLDNLKEVFNEKLEEPLSIRYTLNNPNEKIWLESTIFFTTSKGEKQVSILTKNVTENAESMRKQNVMLQNALKEAKQANEAKTEFLSTLSHDIRTPMNAITGLSSSILKEDLSKEIKEDVENIYSASNNILEIIDGLLDISKIESGKLELEEKEYNLAKIFKDINNITKENIANKNIKLELNINKNLPSILYGDSKKIKQVLLNLLENATRYVDNGIILLSADGERINSKIKLTLSIKDTGIGMNEEELNNLFKDKKNNLYFIKRIVDTLKGDIQVESKEGIGSNFKVVIEQGIVDDKAIGDIDDYKEEKLKEEIFNAEGKKILVVDDNKINLKVATKLLNEYKVNIDTSLSGMECLELVKKNQYDLILLDQMMPEMDGIETLKNLKNIDGFKTPVVVLTADAIKGVEEKYLSEGFDGYLSKPIDTKKLNDTLKKYLS